MNDVDRPARSLRRLAIASITAIVGGVLMLLALFYWRPRPGEPTAEQYAYAPHDEADLPELWKAPSFSFLDQHGQGVTPATLRGHPWIADFIYTECTSACPMITAKMVLLQRALAGTDVRFVSFSVDPEHDSPAALAQYAKRWNATETHWSLLSTDPKHLEETTSGFRVTAKATGDPANPILHTDLFLLVDDQGWVRGAYDSMDDSARAKLAADAQRLSAGARADAAIPQDDSLYTSLGCAGCHANPQIAPPLADLLGSEVRLRDGTQVTADRDYIRRSIVEPSAQRVAGYPEHSLMPSYANVVSPMQLSMLVDEVATMRSDAGRARDAPPAALVVDPVCQMTIRAEPDTLHTTYEGHDVYFCSELCRDSFLRNPAKFSTSPVPQSDR